MAHKKKHTAPVPSGNQSKAGPAGTTGSGQKMTENEGVPFSEQDPKRRLGDFESAGEHARQQPTTLNDGTQHSQ